MQIASMQSAGELGTFAAGLLISGVVSGLVAGLLGVGGGIVVVPVLYHVLALLGVDEAVRMHVAIGTSLATIVPTSISSIMAHARKDAVDWTLLRRWTAPMLLGVVAGIIAAGAASGRILSLVFATVALVVAVHFAFNDERRRIAERLPAGPKESILPFGIGWISTMMGIGGGTVGVPVLTLFGWPIHRAVGTASAFGIIISVPGTIGAVVTGLSLRGLPPYSIGFVNLLAFVLIAPASFVMAPVGATLAHAVDRRRLRIVFAAFIAITSARMFYDALS